MGLRVIPKPPAADLIRGGQRFSDQHHAPDKMKSAWVERDAKAAVDRYGKAGIAADLALRIYSTQLLGRDAKLVLHGGGNTSLKTADARSDRRGRRGAARQGLRARTWAPSSPPASRRCGSSRCAALRARETLSDDEMARAQRAYLIDPQAPSPSVEMLLHAFMPAKFVDHTHATAVLSLIDQPNAAELCAEVFGGRLGFVPYLMPGFGLAKKAAAVFEQNPQVEGLILDKHGIFTFGGDAREAYERMIEMVTLAEAAPAEEPQSRVRGAQAAATDRARRRGRADPARRLRACATPAAKARTSARSSNSAPAMRS